MGVAKLNWIAENRDNYQSLKFIIYKIFNAVTNDLVLWLRVAYQRSRRVLGFILKLVWVKERTNVAFNLVNGWNSFDLQLFGSKIGADMLIFL